MPAIEDLTIAVKVDDQASSPLDSILNKVKEIDRVTKSSGFVHLKEVSKSLADFSKAASGLNGVAENFTKISKASNEFSKNLGALGKANLSNATKQLNDIGNAVNKFNTSALSTKGFSFNVSGVSSIARMPKLLREVGSNFAFAARKGKEFATIPLKMIFAPLGGVMQRVKNLGSAFSGLLTMIKRVAVMRAIRAGIKMIATGVREGVNNLYLWASAVGNSFVPTMDSLATSFQYLKNSIGAAASPILDVLAPAVEVAVNKFVELLNVFNQVISSITGASTWRKALRAPASYSDSISGLGHDATDANDAVKELKRTLLGFDEINRLDDATKTVSPKVSGKDATGYYAKDGALSFTELPISQKALDIAQMLKDAWAKGDFTSIGTMLGEKIGTALQNVPWTTKIQPAVQKLASSFGTLLNGMFDYTGSGGKAMWDGIAYTIYNAINTAVLGYVTFFNTVNWNGIGQGIGAALKKVCKNINWDLMADALSAFPNAIIDALTGFTKQFTTQDFYNVGKNIGSTVSKAIAEIKWADLFKNTFKIATGIVAAFNGALTSFDWSSVKGAILGGIKKIPKKTWSDLGTQIGNAIFNITVFVANLVDTFVRFVEAGNWGALYDGIKTGLTNGMKQYGGWKGIAKKLGDWIVEHIGTLNIIFAIAIGLPLLKALPAAFATTVMNALKLKQVPGTGMTLGSWVKALSLAAGIVLTIDTMKTILDTDFNKGDLKTKIGNVAGIAIRGAVSGALVGFGVGGFTGGLYGVIIGSGLSLSISALKMLADDLKAGDTTSFLTKLGGGIVGSALGAAIGLTFGPAGAVVGGVLGFGLGVSLTLLIEKLIPDLKEGAVQLAKETWEGSMLQGIINEIFGPGAKISADDYEKAQHAWDNVDDETLAIAFGINEPRSGSVVAQESHRVGAADKNTVPVRLYPTVKKLDVYAAWKQLAQLWGEITKTNTVTQFSTKGLNNQSRSWLSQLTDWWGAIVGKNNVKEFTTKGLKNQSRSWWSQLTGWWNAIVGLNKAKEFQTTGVKNQSGSWWRQLTGWWNEIVNNNKAKDFRVDVKDDSSSWWRSVKRWWSEVTSGNSLKSTVSIDNAYNAFVSAWNTMQKSFNNNPLTAYVKTVQTGTKVGGSIKGALTNPSGTVVNTKTGKSVVGSNGAWNIDITSFLKKKKKKASGGIYKNGQWHDITNYAVGGLPMSGEMFIAREAGPELVGSIGGNTAVVNNDQIVASVSAGVAQAVASVLGNGGNTNDITIKVDSEVLYRAVKKGERMASGRYGTAIAIG